jgi:hypothetical protein
MPSVEETLDAMQTNFSLFLYSGPLARRRDQKQEEAVIKKPLRPVIREVLAS